MNQTPRRTILKQGFLASTLLLFEPYLRLFKKLDEHSKPTWHQLVEVARWCPTIHNLQPHQLKIINDEQAELYCDVSRTLPVGDPDGTFVMIALGIFIEHLKIAASAHGYTVLMSELIQPVSTKKSGSLLIAKLTLEKITKSETIDPSLIYLRRTSRLHYDGKLLSEAALEQIRIEAEDYQHDFYYDSTKTLVDSVIEINQRTLFDDLNNDATRNELDRLFRYNDPDAEKYKDGLWYKAMCFPGNLMRSVFQNHGKWNHGGRGKVLAAYYKHSFAGTSTICWFNGKLETPQDLLNAGYMFARTWLLITKHNAYLHPFGTLITNVEANKEINKILKQSTDPNRKIWMIFRVGYSQVPARSFRLATDEIIIK